jgi:hypothetical protein
MDDQVFLDKAIHLNRFSGLLSLESEEGAHILEQLVLTIDGSIVGVKRDAVQKFFSDAEVRAYRYGIKKMPREFPVKNEEDFFRLLAILTPLSET